ncbi:Spermidine Putrescine ABC transporter permease component PotB (TC 3.A.1.11.1) [Citrobacter freundii]|uniref:Spermidine Putrescine ABC transporter permease component PotB (TC 3.A.1.11.1) n=1 Tax=Citrobacter freundii TaxID=546 RepID=A0A7G2IWD9_CITFR|nr:Spermidine Putrescine ABC transporter permease component PotB (TC 3.A.1.11.1) [Citrobacter freundii]
MIVTIVGWLVLFVFLPNLMIIGTSFLTRDDANFVKMVFTLENYTRLLDPLYFEVLVHSLNMALIATLSCLVLGYPFAWFLVKLPEKSAPAAAFPADCSVLDQLTYSHLRTQNFSSVPKAISTSFCYGSGLSIHPFASCLPPAR